MPLEGDPAELWPLLSEDERARADRFRFESDRRHYINARGSLRRVLGDVRIEYGPKGKPFVRGGPHFNVSHSGGMALIAICEKSEVGVDIELVRDTPLANGGDLREFFERWTRMEALVKAIGEGLGVRESVSEAGWSFFDVSPGAEFVGTLAVKEGDWIIRF